MGWRTEKKISLFRRMAIFYDELPLRVRLIDFSKPNGEFEIQLAPYNH